MSRLTDIPHFHLESLEEVHRSGFNTLLERHWREIAHYQDIELDPDWEGYAQAENAGRLRIFTARVLGELVGYVLFFVAFNPHYRSSKQATQDVLFISPEYRKNGLGARLLDFAEHHLRIEGVQVVYQHSKAKTSANIGPFLKELGYELVDTLWAKRLDQE